MVIGEYTALGIWADLIITAIGDIGILGITISMILGITEDIMEVTTVLIVDGTVLGAMATTVAVGVGLIIIVVMATATTVTDGLHATDITQVGIRALATIGQTAEQGTMQTSGVTEVQTSIREIQTSIQTEQEPCAAMVMLQLAPIVASEVQEE